MPKISTSDKLLLLTNASSVLVKQIQMLDKSGDLNCLPAEITCALHNMCEWVDGVIREHDAYMPWCSDGAAEQIALRHAKEPNAKDDRAAVVGSVSSDVLGADDLPERKL